MILKNCFNEREKTVETGRKGANIYSANTVVLTVFETLSSKWNNLPTVEPTPK
jgi:hypothetical protein